MGFYAPQSTWGNPDDFKELVDFLHRNDIGVFIDFVAAHFCPDSWGLANYCDKPTYEYSNPLEGVSEEWGTKSI